MRASSTPRMREAISRNPLQDHDVPIAYVAAIDALTAYLVVIVAPEPPGAFCRPVKRTP